MTPELDIPEDLLTELEVAATIATGQPCSAIVVVVPLSGARELVAMYSKMSDASTNIILAGLLAGRLEDVAQDELRKAGL